MNKHKYGIGDIYLYREGFSDSFVIKQIVECDYSVSNNICYKFRSHSNYFNKELYGWDYEEQVDDGKELLNQYYKKMGM